jgi:hypothetical protein
MKSNRRDFVKSISMVGAMPLFDFNRPNPPQQIPPKEPPANYGNVIEAPANPADWEKFRETITKWRIEKRKELSYTGSTYRDPQFHWTATNHCCCFLMMYDLEFYDPVAGIYTVDKILARGKKEFGGYDSVVLWHAYPRIGFDERNQFDFYRDMPGSLPGVKKVVDEFHRAGVKVFINYNPWDTGTTRETKPDIDVLAEMVAAMDVDGIFLDTLKEGGADFREKLDRIRPGIVLEGELAAELAILPTHHHSWAQWFGDKYVPGILRDKWYERNHIQHQIARWDRDHSTELQQAWMNGSGMMVWENVFGQWIAWSERDKSILRTISPIQKRYHRLFNGEGWTPLVQTKIEGIFASLWKGDHLYLWTLVNRHNRPISGDLIEVPFFPEHAYYDLVSGQEAALSRNGNTVTLSGTIPPRSVGCFLCSKIADQSADLEDFLRMMREIHTGYEASTGFPSMVPLLKSVAPTALSPDFEPKEMVELLPVAIRQRREVFSRECGGYESYPPEFGAPLFTMAMNEKIVFIPHLAIDIYPVTNKQFGEFLRSSGYRPQEPYNFLKHWTSHTYPEQLANDPVVYVDLSDARAFAQWANKRLPREEEWQFAAQGYDKLKYPWGNEFIEEYCNNSQKCTTSVDAFPEGKSPFGCMDMCGNVWELTESEYSDDHNRFCMLKGGSYFQAKGSQWYTQGGPQPSTVSAKFLMLYPGLDRSPTIGFRCVRDLA